MAESHTVEVSEIATTTTKQHLYDFFAFCGKISDVSITETTDKTQKALVSFEKPTAAKTALMLNGGTLDGATIVVTSEKDHVDLENPDTTHPIEQTDKPRAGIAAEYLAHGYKLSDSILQRAIDIDQKQGISRRFLSYLKQVDTTVGTKALGPDQTLSGKVTSTAKSLDEQHGITKTATDYYTKAISSPWGQKVFSFYTTTSKQVLDIHEEARRIADTHKASATSTAAPTEAPIVPPTEKTG